MNLLYKIIQTAAAMWLGMQLTAGYVTAPILFRLLPKMQAGEIAGILFAITALCGLFLAQPMPFSDGNWPHFLGGYWSFGYS